MYDHHFCRKKLLERLPVPILRMKGIRRRNDFFEFYNGTLKSSRLYLNQTLPNQGRMITIFGGIIM